MGNSKMLTAALYYLNTLNYSVIPVGKDKKPLIKWEGYQKTKATEDEVKAWFDKWPEANIGIVTGMVSDLAVIDIDTQEGMEAIQEYLPDTMVAPICTTPKGGRHIYFRCPDAKLANNARVIPGCDLRANGGYVVAPPSVNGEGKGYEWIADFKINKVSVPALPSAYLGAIRRNTLYINNNSLQSCSNNVGKNEKERTPVASVALTFELGRRDEDLFSVANALAKGGMNDANIMQVLKNIAKNWGEEHNEQWFQDKIASAIKRHEHREFNLTREIECYTFATDGDFSATECYSVLQSAADATNCYRINKKSVGDILRRLKDRGIIQKSGSKDGYYRRVDDVASEIDFLNADTTPLPIVYPLGVEELVNTMSKNIIIVAGASDSGKTAFLLRFVAMNMKKHKIHYFSSEMGANELKNRLSKFEDVSLQEFAKNAKWKERVGNFSDVISPDDINIIDFLEMHDNFYQVGMFIKEIFDRLNKGIAIIAIQKNKGQDFALGGQRSVEKARLYLSMDSGRVKIVKGKNWRNPDKNPNNRVAEFKIVQGCKFIPTTLWVPESELEQDAHERGSGKRW